MPFNYLLLVPVLSEDDDYEEKFRHNTHLALRDTSLFLCRQ